MDEVKKQIEALGAKVKLLHEHYAKIEKDAAKPKIIDLTEKTGEKKNLLAQGDAYAN